jgi:histidine kinase
MKRRRSLAFRLLVANLLVVLIGAAAAFVTARLLGPHLFDDEVHRIGMRYGWSRGGGPGSGSGTGQQPAAVMDDLNDAFAGSLDLALVVGLGAGVLAAAAAAAVVSRRMLRPLERVGSAVRDMAAGAYDTRIPEPEDRELAELASDVEALGAALSATERHRTRLVSDLSHELRTPITSLDGFLEGLEDGVFEADPPTLASMRDETRRLRRLTDDLGALSRAAEGAFELRTEAMDAGEVARAAARARAAALTAAGVGLVLEDLPPLPVAADPDRLAQVFANLLDNALRHTPRGGTVTVSGRATDEEVQVSVSDTGEGIAPADLGRVFDRFFRVGGEEAAGGTGIGLTIARGIARAHGGELVARSGGLGRGATFTVTLPRSV